jgi:hypothetical protein
MTREDSMADIQQFIRTATSALAIDEGTAKRATGGLLGFLGRKMGKGDFQALLGQLPGAADLVPESGKGSRGGLLGSLGKVAGGALGGKLGGAAGVLEALGSSGLDPDRIPAFVGQFVGFAKQNVSGDVLGKLLSHVPDLHKVAH